MEFRFGDSIDTYYYLSGQEHLFIGSSPLPQFNSDIYVPRALLQSSDRSKDLIEKISLIRSVIGVYIGTYIGSSVGINKPLALSLESLDLTTGKTTADPRIMGIWDFKNKRILTVMGRDLDNEYRKFLLDQEFSSDLRYYMR